MEQRLNLIVLAPLFLLIAANLIFLDIAIFSPTKKTETSVITTEKPDIQGSCTAECKTLIQAELAKLPSAVPTPLPLSASPVSAPIAQNIPKEFYIPLGSGKTKNDGWEDLAGAESYIDTNLYPNLKQVTFEATVSIPQGIGWMYAKLYNVTDKHPVWFSEVTTESNIPSRKEAKITLDSGNKLYRIQAKSTLRSDALVENARIKVLTY